MLPLTRRGQWLVGEVDINIKTEISASSALLTNLLILKHKALWETDPLWKSTNSPAHPVHCDAARFGDIFDAEIHSCTNVVTATVHWRYVCSLNGSRSGVLTSHSEVHHTFGSTKTLSRTFNIHMELTLCTVIQWNLEIRESRHTSIPWYDQTFDQMFALRYE